MHESLIALAADNFPVLRDSDLKLFLGVGWRCHFWLQNGAVTEYFNYMARVPVPQNLELRAWKRPRLIVLRSVGNGLKVV